MRGAKKPLLKFLLAPLQGLYRLSGVKSKVDQLSEDFDANPAAVDLTEQHPNVITNVLKNYLRSLPDPILTNRLYNQFVQIAKVLFRSSFASA